GSKADVRERSPGAVPQGERRGIILSDERGGEPQRVQLTRAAGRRLGAHLLPEALEQRDGERVAFLSEAPGVALGEGEATFDGTAARDQRGGGAGHDGDSRQLTAPRRRHGP